MAPNVWVSQSAGEQVGLIDTFWTTIVGKLGQELAVIAVTILGAIGYAALRLIWKQVQKFWCFVWSRHRALKAVGRTTGVDGRKENAGVWTTPPIHQPTDYERDLRACKILAVANLKGGVGKTTLVANIGAYLSSEWAKKILLIDLDYQGSLSSMALPQDDRWLPPPGQDSVMTRAISGDLDASLFASLAKDTLEDHRLKIGTAYYDLAQADTRVLVEWLLKCRAFTSSGLMRRIGDVFYGRLFQRHDPRYQLARLLHAPAIQNCFDLVIIDCPPRLTTGTMQALCASSHVLIPTILDRPSSEAVISFARQIEALKKQGICPYLKYIGVVATKYRAGAVAARKAELLIADRLSELHINTGLIDQSLYVPQTQAFVRDAEDGIAYFVMGNDQGAQNARSAVEALAEYVANQMGVPRPPSKRTVRSA